MSLPRLDSVLVLGGCGFLGHHIAKQASLASDVTKVTVFDLDILKNRIPGVEYIQGSITSKDDVELTFNSAKPTVVFHTVSPSPFSKNHKLFDEVNVTGTKIILDCAKKSSSAKALVYTSSSSVIHDNWSDMINATEDATVIFAPQQPEYYSHKKAVAETLVLGANGDQLRTTAIRPAGLFGEGDTLTVTNVISNAREGKGRLQIGDNSNSFDFTYSTLPIENLRVDGEVFVISNDEPWHFWTFTRAIGAAAGYPIADKDVVAVPWRVMMGVAWALEWGYWIFTLGRQEPRLTQARVKYTTMERTIDITKAKERLGYRPQVGIQEGIDRSARWFLESHR